MVMRSIIESSIKQHYLSQGKSSVGGMLGQVVPTLVADYGKESSIKRPINLLQNAIAPNERPGSSRWFNAVCHDPARVVRAREVREAWQELEPLLSFLIGG